MNNGYVFNDDETLYGSIVSDDELLAGALNYSSDSMQGPAGKSAYETAIDNGFVGTEVEWLASLQGEQGIDGATGPSNVLSVGNVVGGDVASATITGTSPAQVLNLVLPKGDKGNPGDTGATGAAGATGPSNVLSVGTVTGGVTASATITGTSPAQILNLVLPKGDVGAQGIAGTDGKEVELQKSSTAIQWKYDTDPSWTDLIAISELKGDKGDTGAAGTQGTNGYTPYIQNDYWYINGVSTGILAIGQDGNGITSITKTNTVGLVDTYTITYDDSSTSQFYVTNGEDGVNGTNGINGRGITSISKTGTSGLVDTYTITYSDLSTSTYTITNGAKGDAGTNGTNGTNATINGVNTATISGGSNVNITQAGSVLTINAVVPTQLSDLSDDSAHRTVTDVEKSTWNSKQNSLVADTDYLTPTTASSTYQVKMGTDDNYVTDVEKSQLHTHSNKSSLDLVSGTNTGDQDLSGYEPLLPTTPSNPDAMFLNGLKQWSPMAISGGGVASNVYYTTIASDVSGYSVINYVPEATETITSTTITNSEVLARTYLFPNQISTTVIDAGVWTSAYYAKVDGTQGVTQLAIEPFLRHIDGTETVLFKGYSREMNETEYVLVKDEVQQPIFNCVSTDRLGVRIYAKTTASNAITINTKLGGVTAGYFVTPLALRHDQLRDKNGNNNYLHLTDSEKTAITHTNRSSLDLVSGTNTGDQDLSGYALLETGTIIADAVTISQALSPNVNYKTATLSTCTTLTLTLVSGNWFDEYILYFTTSTTAPTITLPSGITWVGGTPTFSSNKTYIISIQNGIGVVASV